MRRMRPSFGFAMLTKSSAFARQCRQRTTSTSNDFELCKVMGVSGAGALSAQAQILGRCLAEPGCYQFVADLGTLCEPSVARSFNRRNMDEHVLALAIRLDEAVALGCVKPLHGSHRHFSISSEKTDQTNVIRQTNWWQVGGKKP